MDRGRNTAWLAVPIAALGLAVAGCGDSKSKSTSTSSAGTTTATAPAKTDAAMQTRLEDVVLTSKAVGPDWKIAKPSEVAPVINYCNRALAKGVKPVAQTTAAFQQRFGSAVTQDLWAYADVADAKQVIDDFRKLVESCPSWKTSPEIGRTVKYTMKKLDVSGLGDEAVAARLSSANTFGGFEVVHSFVAVMVRRATVIDLVTQTANAGLFMSAVEVEKLARKADRRLASSR